MSERGLRRFLDAQIEEGEFLDYKQAIPDGFNEAAKREFLKDVSGFANNAGGLLLYGVKEPSDATTNDQIIGIPEEGIAQRMEQCAASQLDPRVSGLLIRPIPIDGGDPVLLVWVPPSTNKPHLSQKDGRYYVRHNESTMRMSASEVRQAVLSTENASAGVERTLERGTDKLGAFNRTTVPAFYLQAAPLIRLAAEWDVLSVAVDEVVRGREREYRYAWPGEFNIVPSVRPKPTMEGLEAVDRHSDPEWVLHVNRDGYIGLWQAIHRSVPRQHPNLGEIPILHRIHWKAFQSFCDLAKSLWVTLRVDAPYVFRARACGVASAIFDPNERGASFMERVSPFGPYEEPSIEWPDEIYEVGGDLDLVHRRWYWRLYHAFGATVEFSALDPRRNLREGQGPP